MDCHNQSGNKRKDRYRLHFNFPMSVDNRPGTDGFSSATSDCLSGIRRILSCSRSYIANCATPISDIFALEAIRLLYKYLPVAVKDGNNLKARAKVAWASTLAGMLNPHPVVLPNILSSTLSAHTIPLFLMVLA